MGGNRLTPSAGSLAPPPVLPSVSPHTQSVNHGCLTPGAPFTKSFILAVLLHGPLQAITCLLNIVKTSKTQTSTKGMANKWVSIFL